MYIRIFFCVNSVMFLFGNCNKIFDPIILHVAVFVVYVVTGWDRTNKSLIY